MMEWDKVKALKIPEGNVKRLELNGQTLWERWAEYAYVSFGDSIAAGHAINDEWEDDYGSGSQYGVNGNLATTLVPGCYTALIRDELAATYGAENIFVRSFARSGDKVEDLIDKLTHGTVQRAARKADLITICIGANDVLTPVMHNLEDYISAGDPALQEIIRVVNANLVRLADDSNANSFKALFDRITALNPDAKIVFTTIYNPYKYLWLDEGRDGFFAPLLNTIPEMNILGFDIDKLIKDGLLGTDIVQLLFERVNGLDVYAENFVSQLNTVLRNKVAAYQSTNPNILLADTKAVFDGVPDRPISATKHYNDLVSVEYTRGYDTAQMDWGRLWEGSDAATFWVNLATKYTSWSGFDLGGFAADLIDQIVLKVVMPDTDPHPEPYGHYLLKRSFVDELGWTALDRYTITYNANGGSGSMATQIVLGADGLAAFTNIDTNTFAPGTEGYYFTGWNTAADGSGTAYTNGQLIGISGNLTLYAQWSNLYAVTYKHTNHTNLYGDDETGHMECYNLYINGELMPKLGKFSAGNAPTYYVPYGTTVKVAVSNYNPSEITYDDVDCNVYWNGANVASGYRGTEYTFALTSNLTIDFRWKIAGSLITFNAQSWEDCYITTA